MHQKIHRPTIPGGTKQMTPTCIFACKNLVNASVKRESFLTCARLTKVTSYLMQQIGPIVIEKLNMLGGDHYI